jgi:hypothetical protein
VDFYECALRSLGGWIVIIALHTYE